MFAAVLVVSLKAPPGPSEFVSAAQTTAAPAAEVQALKSQLAEANQTIELQRQAIAQLQRQVVDQRPAENIGKGKIIAGSVFLLLAIIILIVIIRAYDTPQREPEGTKRGLELPPPPPGPMPE
jgi:hypothetical protein